MHHRPRRREVLVLLTHLGIVAQEEIGVDKQVVEVHGAGLAATLLIAAVDLAHERCGVDLVVSPEVRVTHIELRQDELVLGSTDATADGRRLVLLVIELHLLDDNLDEALAVRSIIDSEVRGIAEAVAFDAQDAREDAVEGAHPET